MTKPNVAAILIAALLLIIAAACKDRSKTDAMIAVAAPATQSAEEKGAENLPVLTPPPNASREHRLIIAAYNGELPTIQKLLAEGADINAPYEVSPDSYPWGADVWPTIGAPPAVVGARVWPDLVAHIGKSALDEALSRGRFELAAYLLDHGADVNDMASGDGTGLQLALLDPRRLDFLIARGADVNMKDYRGRSPLYFAVALDQLGAARKLLKAGADVNAQDGTGETSLHAVQGAAMARLLLAAGARVDLKDENGFTPLMKVEWSAERIKLEWALARMQEALEASMGNRPLRRLSLPARGSDLDELKKAGIKGQMLSHRLNDLRETKTKGIASVLEQAVRSERIGGAQHGARE